MRYLSVCSGIEAATVAWHNLGWTPVGFSEIEPFPSAVLAHHYPNVPNFGDMTQHEQWPLQPGSIDLLVGGTPCQSFSVAGLRKGLHDPRGGLMLTYLEIARRLRPQWVVWENVPGVLSSNGGRDFGSFLGAMGELGYGWAYRILDAQWVRTQRHPRAVPQRRRRVFVVGCLIERCAGDWASAAQVLFERESVQRDSAPRRTTRQGAAADAEVCAGTVSSKWAKGTGGSAGDECYNLTTQVSATIAARFGNSRNNHEECVTQPVASTLGNRGLRSHTELDGHGAYVPVPYDLFQITAPVNRQNRKPGDPCHTLARDNAAHAAVAFQGGSQQDQILTPDAVVPTLAHASNSHGGHHQPKVWTTAPTLTAASMTVRRLTPRECERLQGFPDDYTLIPWRKKAAADCPDGPRYKALGNSMAVNCMAWIGERIAAVENHNAN